MGRCSEKLLMTTHISLTEFLSSHVIESVEVLPDLRLINVIVDGGVIAGVVVDNIPNDVTIVRLPAVLEGSTILAGALTFNVNDYVMLRRKGDPSAS